MNHGHRTPLLELRHVSVTEGLRGTGMAVILQQAMTAFDPLRPLGKQLTGTLRDRRGLSAARAREDVRDALQRVGLPETVLDSYPHQLSGGMLQRCMIALTLALRPALVVADEPTTALDACHQRQVLRCLADVARDASLIFVSHDLGAVQQLADEVLVMQAGSCVEYGQAAQLFDAPVQACTRHLVRTRLALWRGFRRALGDK